MLDDRSAGTLPRRSVRPFRSVPSTWPRRKDPWSSGLDEVQGLLDKLCDPWLGHPFISEVVLAEDRHPDAVDLAQVLKVTRIYVSSHSVQMAQYR